VHKGLRRERTLRWRNELLHQLPAGEIGDRISGFRKTFGWAAVTRGADEGRLERLPWTQSLFSTQVIALNGYPRYRAIRSTP